MSRRPRYSRINFPAGGIPGPQGPVGPSDAMDNVFSNIPSGVALGSRASVGIPTAATGTASQPVPTASLVGSLSRTQYTSTVGAGLSAGQRSALGLWWLGNAAGLGGFSVRWRFAVTSFLAGHRAFVGFRAITGAIANVNPSTLVNIVGMGYDAAATEWAIMHNDAAGAATQVALGPTFAVSVTDLLELTISAPSNAASFDWEAVNLSSGATQAGNLAANIPANTTFLASFFWANTGADATTAAIIDVVDNESLMPVPTP